MYLAIIACSAAAALALPSQPSTAVSRSQLWIDLPDSPSVIEVLANPSLYEQLSAPFQQTPLQLAEEVFKKGSHSSTCGARAECPAYEGKSANLYGREYKLYCHNGRWGSYFWLPPAKSLEEYEASRYKNSNPSHTSVTMDTKRLAPSQLAFGPRMLCPLPGSDNQIYDFGPNKEYQFKMSCTNHWNVPASAKKSLGTTKNVDECGEKCGEQAKCYGFHYYQPIFPGGRYDGSRTCEIITQPIEDGQWTSVFKPNQYLAGLAVGSHTSGDKGWNQDQN